MLFGDFEEKYRRNCKKVKKAIDILLDSSLSMNYTN